MERKLTTFSFTKDEKDFLKQEAMKLGISMKAFILTKTKYRRGKVNEIK